MHIPFVANHAFSATPACNTSNPIVNHYVLYVFITCIVRKVCVCAMDFMSASKNTFLLLNTDGIQLLLGISKKNHQNARGFAQEFLQSGKCYRPGRSVKWRGKSSSLHSKRNFFGWGFFVSDVISGGLLGHLGPLYLDLGPNHSMAVFCWSFHRKLGYNPSLLILWMTCWVFSFKSYDLK